MVLKRSVLTSCSDRRLQDLLRETSSITRTSCFDLYLLRAVDIDEIEGKLIYYRKSGPQSLHSGNNEHAYKKKRLQPERRSDGGPDNRTISEILSYSENVNKIVDWVHYELSSYREWAEKKGLESAQIPALATYFPEISSCSKNEETSYSRSKLAEKALANSIIIALELKEKRWMEHAIIEMVCGNVLDICNCDKCENDRLANNLSYVFETSRERKMEYICESLMKVVEIVQSRRGKDESWVLALELEPGPTYVLNNKDALNLFINILGQTRFSNLKQHVALNLDIAHMKIAEVEANILRKYLPLIAHSHICDHPDMHTRDQVVGSWNPVDLLSAGDVPYLKLLNDRLKDYTESENEIPFSGAVALELEGCNRIQWIHHSMVAMKHMFESLAENAKVR